MAPEELLTRSGIRYQRYRQWPSRKVYLSAANQLLAPYADLKLAQAGDKDYVGWEAHHIFEFADLERLGALGLFPPYERQLCVLLPPQAHRSRINQILRSSNPPGMKVTASYLRSAYQMAYAMVGNYSGGGEAAIRKELMSVVDAVLQHISK